MPIGERLLPRARARWVMAFVALVLVAVVANKTNASTLTGAQLFVWARVAYALIYLAGIPWLRTLACRRPR